MSVEQPLVTADEVEVVSVSGAALLELSSRLNGTPFTSNAFHTKSSERESGVSLPFVKVEDGISFLGLLHEVIHHHATELRAAEEEEEQRFASHETSSNHTAKKTQQRRFIALRYLVFEVQPRLLATILSLLHAPRMMSEEDELCRLFCSALMFLQSVALTCCVVSKQTQEEERCDDGWRLPLEALELSAMTTDLFERLGAVHTVTDLLYDEFPLSVRHAAAQLLFVFLLRDGSNGAGTRPSHVRETLSIPARLAVLLAVTSSTPTQSIRERISSRSGGVGDADMDGGALYDTEAASTTFLSLRLHTAACLRELANTHHECFTSHEILNLLHRISEVEPNGDLRALSIELLHVVLSHRPPSFWDALPLKKELAALCARQLEREIHHDALRATLCLMETLIMCECDAAFKTSSISFVKRNTVNGEAGVCETLLALFVDRTLTALITNSMSSLTGGFYKNNTNNRNNNNNSSTSNNRHRYHYGNALGLLFHAPQRHSNSHLSFPSTVSSTVQPRRPRGEAVGMNASGVATSTACLAARCLRMLIQHAPYDRHAALFLLQHRPSAACVLEISVRLAEQFETGCGDEISGGRSTHHHYNSNNNNNNKNSKKSKNKNCSNSYHYQYNNTNNNNKNMYTVEESDVTVNQATLMLAVELAILLGLCLAQDPRARRFVGVEFSLYLSEAQLVRRALLSNLNLVALTYFGEGTDGSSLFHVVDVTGVQLNALNAVEWDTLDRPSRASVHELFVTQDQRWDRNEVSASYVPLEDSKSINERRSKSSHGSFWMGTAAEHNVSPSFAVSDAHRHQCLTFIVLSYAIHYTFKFACEDAAAAAVVATTGVNSECRTFTDASSIRSGVKARKGGSVEGLERPPQLPQQEQRQIPPYREIYLMDNNTSPARKCQKQQQQQQQQLSLQEADNFAQSPTPRNPYNGQSLPTSLSHAAAADSESRTDPVNTASMHSEHKVELFYKFHRSLRLFRDLASCYTDRPASLLDHIVVYEATGERGMVRRQGRREVRRTLSKELEINKTPSLYPHQQQAPQLKQQQQQQRCRSIISPRGTQNRCWSVEELQEEDLFYFCIPYKQFTIEALQFTRRRALQHARVMKRQLLITPQSAKARRLLLHDVVTNIMPGVAHALSQFIQWFQTHGMEQLRLALLIFFKTDEQQEVCEAAERGSGESRATYEKTQWEIDDKDDEKEKKTRKDVASSLPRAEEVSLHAGNLVLLMHQVSFYLQRRAQTRSERRSASTEERGMSLQRYSQSSQRESSWFQTESPSVGARQTIQKSTLLRDIEQQIKRLQNAEFRGDAEDHVLAKTLLSPAGAVHSAGMHASMRGDTGDMPPFCTDDSEDVEDDFDELQVCFGHPRCRERSNIKPNNNNNNNKKKKEAKVTKLNLKANLTRRMAENMARIPSTAPSLATSTTRYHATSTDNNNNNNNNNNDNNNNNNRDVVPTLSSHAESLGEKSPVAREYRHPFWFVNNNMPATYWNYDNATIDYNSDEPYELIQKIGRGKYSEVFRGRNRNNGELCVLKILKPVRLRKIRREVTILQNLCGGPNVVRLLDVVMVSSENTPVLVTENMEPADNFRSLMHAKLLTNFDMRYYLYEIFRCLNFSHSRGIFHRDIKPYNIIIEHRHRKLRIIDWGLAEYYFHGQAYNLCVGTRHFKGPELLAGLRLYDYALDIWSVGCIFAELLFRIVPFFRGDDNEDQLLQILHVLGTDDLMQYICKYNLHIPRQLMERCLAVKRSKRSWQSFINPLVASWCDAEAIDLLDKMLRFDHQQRITAAEAMQHPFFDPVRKSLASNVQEQYEREGVLAI